MKNWLRSHIEPVQIDPAEEPPTTARDRGEGWVAGHDERDLSPAVGRRGEPGRFRRFADRAAVTLANSGWGDARWSYLYKADTEYATARPNAGELATAARRMRSGPPPDDVRGPIIKPPVWSWEVPLYFWFGGIAAGSSFAALGCDLAGDHRSAMIARRVSLGALVACPPLLISDLGRPLRFPFMLRIFKPRSPMSMGSWCLTTFGALGAGAVGADLLARPRAARWLGGGMAFLGGYLGSYTGVLLATTAVPLWNRSRLFLGPLFVATATATGAAATRLVLSGSRPPGSDDTRRALAKVETGAMLAELALSAANQRRLGPLAEPLHRSTPGRMHQAAELAIFAGLALRVLGRRFGPAADHAASGLYLTAGLAFRYAWVMAGRASAASDHAVARTARAQTR
jgi:Polysulphide reductase, NrfD